MRLSWVEMKGLKSLALAGAILIPALGCTRTKKVVVHETVEHEAAIIAMDQVPQAARDAALAALPGLTPTSAEVEIEKGVTVYELKGMANGKKMEVEVTADGKVLEVEEDDD